MPEITLGEIHKVDIIESERGWGSKIDETKFFTSKKEAEDFVKEFNSKNDYSGPVPDWYVVAAYVGKIS